MASTSGCRPSRWNSAPGYSISVNSAGTAALPGVFYSLLAANGRNFPQAAAITLGVAVASLLLALAVAMGEWRAGKRRGESPCGPPEHIPDA